ncbi:hypothetical protein F4780DRAFT_531395 [Xylariomycetidae sp. FL0641]|nr:hypothetical protein F4780DRAFT_531395 [Xylariomycetidae sp. FL0641]
MVPSRGCSTMGESGDSGTLGCLIQDILNHECGHGLGMLAGGQAGGLVASGLANRAGEDQRHGAVARVPSISHFDCSSIRLPLVALVPRTRLKAEDVGPAQLSARVPVTPSWRYGALPLVQSGSFHGTSVPSRRPSPRPSDLPTWQQEGAGEQSKKKKKQGPVKCSIGPYHMRAEASAELSHASHQTTTDGVPSVLECSRRAGAWEQVSPIRGRWEQMDTLLSGSRQQAVKTGPSYGEISAVNDSNSGFTHGRCVLSAAGA